MRHLVSDMVHFQVILKHRNMKTFISFMLALFFACTVYSQTDVTTFLGIPVDGSKTDMRRKLIAKGFTPTKLYGQDFLEGEFNGSDVRLYIGTNKNKVYRIALSDATRLDEANIKIRFNNLVSQFKNNKRYTHFEDYELSASEDIPFEMLVNNKTYDAIFFQNPDIDTVALRNQFKEEISNGYTKDQQGKTAEEIKEIIIENIASFCYDMMRNKIVWFRIKRDFDGYYIVMYYDNEYNRAHGEDL